MSTHNICFCWRNKKNVSTVWLEKKVLSAAKKYSSFCLFTVFNVAENQADADTKEEEEKPKQDEDAETKSNESKPNTPTEISSLLPVPRERESHRGVHRQNRRPIRSLE